MMPDMMALASPAIGGSLLIAAGIWQLTPLKNTCLVRCQSPFFYLARNWRQGAAGAFATGFGHGRYCLGCCWVLMALLFYGGVMSLAWIGGLAFYVLLEKVLPRRYRLEKLAGVFLLLWGGSVVLGWAMTDAQQVMSMALTTASQRSPTPTRGSGGKIQRKNISRVNRVYSNSSVISPTNTSTSTGGTRMA